MKELTESEIISLIEGYFCYPLSEKQNPKDILESLVNWHETSEEDLKRGLDYWEYGIGFPISERNYDAGYRNSHLG